MGEKRVVEKLFSLIKQTLLQAQTFLRHHSISSSGGFNLLLNGIRILKVRTLVVSKESHSLSIHLVSDIEWTSLLSLVHCSVLWSSELWVVGESFLLMLFSVYDLNIKIMEKPSPHWPPLTPVGQVGGWY